MSPNPDARRTTSFRVRAEVLAQVKTFIRDEAGAPLYLNNSKFWESAALFYIEALKQQLAEGQRTQGRNHQHANPRR